MMDAVTAEPALMPENEPCLEYLPGSPERELLQEELARQSSEIVEIPLLIGGREVRTGSMMDIVMPHDHRHVIARAHLAGETDIDAAIEAAMEARLAWSSISRGARADVFLRAADLLAGPWRMKVNAATMLNQSKTCFQAEVDSACELVDFMRFNVAYLDDIDAFMQPPIQVPGVINRLESRPLEGFIYCVTPFNFTAIAGNLPHAPTLMGNVAIWKPSDWSLLSNWYVMQLFMEAGLPPGVINFLPGDPEAVTSRLLQHPSFAGLHFTGSTTVFQSLWDQIGRSVSSRASYPRIVGETGGKDFVVAHASCDTRALRTALVRGAYEFSGQKCSAASRAYIARSVWESIRDPLVEEIASIRMGDPADFTNFTGAVIHQKSYERCCRYIEAARAAVDTEILCGGGADDTTGWFVEPTLIQTTRADSPSMVEEIFGPVLTVLVYEDDAYETILETCNATSIYGLTGAIFASDEEAIAMAHCMLVNAAGNFYVNDKPSGAVVGQQPFGGGRASGTNDKAGSPLNLLRWISPRTVKENLQPPVDYRYSHMQDD